MKKRKCNIPIEEDFEFTYLYLKNIIKTKNYFGRQKKICFLCTRCFVENRERLQHVQIDNHKADYLSLDDFSNNIPIKAYFTSINHEYSFLNADSQKNALTIEKFSHIFSDENVLSHEFYYFCGNFRKNREYITPKFRVLKRWRSTFQKEIDWKTVLHGWNNQKGIKIWSAQRGDLLFGFIENFIRIGKIEGKKSSKRLKEHCFFFLNLFNQKVYEFELVKRMFCLNFPKKSSRFELHREDQEFISKRLNRFMSNNFSNSWWKYVHFGTYFSNKNKFFENFFYLNRNQPNCINSFFKNFIIS